MKRRYGLADQVAALDALIVHDGDVHAVSTATGISPRHLRRWRAGAEDILARYARQQNLLGARRMADARAVLADRALALAQACDDDRIASAPLNQVASALGVIIDRYLKLEPTDPAMNEQVIRFEYTHPDGQTRSAPPWADDDPASADALQGGRLRAALGQDRTGEDRHHRSGSARPGTRLVAHAHLSDVVAGMARPEDEPDERPWYHD